MSLFGPDVFRSKLAHILHTPLGICAKTSLPSGTSMRGCGGLGNKREMVNVPEKAVVHLTQPCFASDEPTLERKDES